MPEYKIPELPLAYNLETLSVYRQLSLASRALAELKGVAKTIPNENILLNTLVLQEAKDSSEVENIVTTQDELYKADLDFGKISKNVAQKEVLRYREAMGIGFSFVRSQKILTLGTIKKIQQQLEENSAGFRALPGTTLKNGKNEIVYTPPQSREEIERLMGNLERFINDSELSSLDPLVKLPIIHHQFESIHPFYDGNGRTGRIVNVLYLVMNNLLDLPILYLSRYINHNKVEYYDRIQAVRDGSPSTEKAWETWIVFMLKGIEETSKETVVLIDSIKDLMQAYKVGLKKKLGTRYRRELLDNLFRHPYTKIELVMRDLNVTRQTAAKYLDLLTEWQFLRKVKLKNSNYYVNQPLFDLFSHHSES